MGRVLSCCSLGYFLCFKFAFLSIVQPFAIKLTAVHTVGMFAEVAVLSFALRLMPLAEAPLAELLTAFITDVEGDLFHSATSCNFATVAAMASALVLYISSQIVEA